MATSPNNGRPDIPVGQGAPFEVRLFKFGINEYLDPKTLGVHQALVDQQAMENIMAVFNARGIDMVIDYQHQSITGQKAPAAGWIKKLVNRGLDGLWAITDWTKEAADHIAKGEFRYLSPVILIDENTKRLLAIFNVALTNEPMTLNLAPLIASRDGNFSPENTKVFEARVEICGAAVSAAQDGQRDAGATKNLKQKEEKSMKKILGFFGLPPETTEEEALAKLEAWKASSKAAPPPADAQAGTVALGIVAAELGLQPAATETEVVANIRALKSRPGQEAVDRIAALEKESKQRKASDLVALGMLAGKITPAQVPWATDYAGKDPSGFGIYLDKAVRVMALGGAIVKAGQPPAGSGQRSLTDKEQSAAKQLGLSEEDVRKYGPKE